MNATLMCDLLARAASNREDKLELSVETSAHPEASKVLDFLVEQGWLEKDGGDGTWTVTPAGRFWFESLGYGDVLMFHEYGGMVFLLCTRSQAEETIVWHKGRFATIGIAHSPHPEHFEVRRGNEPITTSAGLHMEDALDAACALVAEDLDVPPTAEAGGAQAANVELHGAALKLLVARACRILRHERVPFALVVDRTASEQAE